MEPLLTLVGLLTEKETERSRELERASQTALTIFLSDDHGVPEPKAFNRQYHFKPTLGDMMEKRKMLLTST